MVDLFEKPITVAGYARIAVERGVDAYPDGLTYAIPENLSDVTPGERVIVPLGRGNQRTHGYVVELVASPSLDRDRIKPIEKRGPKHASIPHDLLKLAQWISAYYSCPIGMTLASMLPAAVKRDVGAVTKRMIDLGKPPRPDEKLPPKQQAVLEVLRATEAGARPIEIHDLATRAALKTLGPINRLIERMLLEVVHQSTIQANWAKQTVDTFIPEALTYRQFRIVEDIDACSSREFSAHLLYGVTGSGKTEVYIRLIQRVLDRGKMALMLVPEISLTPQTGGRLIGRFPRERVAVLHSGLTAAQRNQQWAMVADGSSRVILGARSAIFAPVPDGMLGLVIVDEEHDGSYKQDQAPRYHARDVALKRGHITQCPVVLGSATPSLESWFNATTKNTYSLHRLPERAPGLSLPRVKVLDFVAERKKHHDRKVHLIGPTLEHALHKTLHDGRQALFLLNRRGFANYVACPDQMCGWVMTCDHCDASMVYHLRKSLPGDGFVRCHHCLAEQRLRKNCPDCGKHITTFGLGTQRVEKELAEACPQLQEGVTLVRVDSDTMSRAAMYHDVLDRFRTGAIHVLVGTQMIAKGLDFPGVRLVGVINADTAINLPDFRATERTFQLVNQVAGRSGRGSEPGEVIVQSFQPDLPAVQLAARHDYESFATMELEARRSCELPPITRMVRLVIRHQDLSRCVEQAHRIAAGFKEIAEQEVRLRPTAPCPIARIGDYHRYQIEMFAPSPGPLQNLLAAARNAGLIKPGAELAVDVDPIALL